jgi:NADH pyrophosphatase NudC (nudix superfamily)
LYFGKILPLLPEQTITREVKEELGLVADELKFIRHFYLGKFNQLMIAYVIKARGELILSDEIKETRYLSADELVDFDFGALALTQKIIGQARLMGFVFN